MVKLKINGIPVEAEEGTTIIEAARLAGIDIPSLCYLKDINCIGACRVCGVEGWKSGRIRPRCASHGRQPWNFCFLSIIKNAFPAFGQTDVNCKNSARIMVWMKTGSRIRINCRK